MSNFFRFFWGAFTEGPCFGLAISWQTAHICASLFACMPVIHFIQALRILKVIVKTPLALIDLRSLWQIQNGCLFVDRPLGLLPECLTGKVFDNGPSNKN